MKKTFTTIALATVITFGATFANANTGIIMGDGSETCSDTQKDRIIMGDFVGIIMGDLVGIIMGDKSSTPCTDKDGIIVAGRDGIIYGG